MPSPLLPCRYTRSPANTGARSSPPPLLPQEVTYTWSSGRKGTCSAAAEGKGQHRSKGDDTQQTGRARNHQPRISMRRLTGPNRAASRAPAGRLACLPPCCNGAVHPGGAEDG